VSGEYLVSAKELEAPLDEFKAKQRVDMTRLLRKRNDPYDTMMLLMMMMMMMMMTMMTTTSEPIAFSSSFPTSPRSV
jgi:hypothetical protein